MNDILYLKGTFDQGDFTGGFPIPKLPRGKIVTISKLKLLLKSLEDVYNYYLNRQSNYFKGALVSVNYIKVAAKSNRTTVFMTDRNKQANQTVVGAKFSDNGNHIITHYVSLAAIKKQIGMLTNVIKLSYKTFGENITEEVFNEFDFNRLDYKKYDLYKTNFMKMIADAYYIADFTVEEAKHQSSEAMVVTFYNTGKEIKELLTKLNFNVLNVRVLDSSTALLTVDQINQIIDEAPYLISMAVEDLSVYVPSDFDNETTDKKLRIKSPTNEPIIGVIDTLFDDRVYFSEWVEYNSNLDIDTTNDLDKIHGTKVTSIIVDGPRFNPELDDGCGNFRVRHFGVARRGRTSSTTIIRNIRDIVNNNPDIKVWNLSLGSNQEIQNNFVSIEAAELDKLQFEKDVIFIISGTNDNGLTRSKKIGAPADSINALVVNSVDHEMNPAEYSRKGPVLSFFTKPDISYYGGSENKKMNAYTVDGVIEVSGTSYAAPWIARKMAYLIEILGFEREIAKALIIDSATGWSNEKSHFKGYGVVPIHIDEIVKSPEDEIRFILTGTAKTYTTYSYRFPIPFYNNKYPFVTRATMCYFPKSSRNQGVDYTNTELDFYFGRLNDKRIMSIDNNKQSLDMGPVNEEVSRKEFGKWDNVKSLRDKNIFNSRGGKVYPSQRWGMKIVSKDRLGVEKKESMRFGVVVTLKEIDGINRINDFIQMFSLQGWLVNRIDIETRIDIFEKSEQTIDLE